MSQDCYFFIDLNEAVPEDKQKVSVLCIPCRNEHHPDTGWFWNGSNSGYGPWDYICCKCGQKVHEHQDENLED